MTTKPESDEPTITEADVAAAEAAAEAAEQAAIELEEAVRNGDEGVTPEAVANQKNQGVFQRLRAEAARRKLAKSKEAQRLAACRALFDEINAYDATIGDKLSGLLQAVLDARKAFQAAVEDHAQKAAAWRARALELGVAQYDLSGMPPASDGYLAIPRGSALIRAGRREIFILNADQYLDGLKHETDAPVFVESIKTEGVVEDK
jgi:hypothetical protein